MKIPEPRRLPSGMWNVQVSVKGARKSITRATREECIREAALLKAGVKEARILPAEQKTIGEIIDDYMESRAGVLAPSTMYDWKTMRKKRFQRIIGVKYAAVRSWQKEIAEDLRDLEPSSARNYYAMLKAAIRAEGLPVPEISLPKVQPKRKAYLTPEQIPVFLDAIRGHRLEIPMLLGLHGLRVGEVCAIRWKDLDLKKKIIRVDGTVYRDPETGAWIRKETTKNAGSRRSVPILIQRLEELLAEANKKEAPVSTTPYILYIAVNTVCRANGLPLIGNHGLRRSFASLAYSERVPERILMELGGWTNLQTVHRYYVQISSQEVSHYADELRDFFNKKAGPA